jgi:hypothetical protein
MSRSLSCGSRKYTYMRGLSILLPTFGTSLCREAKQFEYSLSIISRKLAEVYWYPASSLSFSGCTYFMNKEDRIFLSPKIENSPTVERVSNCL